MEALSLLLAAALEKYPETHGVLLRRHGLYTWGRPIMVLDPAQATSITGPAAIDGIGPADDWQGYWQKSEASKREAASWANGH